MTVEPIASKPVWILLYMGLLVYLIVGISSYFAHLPLPESFRYVDYYSLFRWLATLQFAAAGFGLLLGGVPAAVLVYVAYMLVSRKKVEWRVSIFLILLGVVGLVAFAASRQVRSKVLPHLTQLAIDSTPIVAAIRAYHDEKGRWPESLSELDPRRPAPWPRPTGLAYLNYRCNCHKETYESHYPTPFLHYEIPLQYSGRRKGLKRELYGITYDFTNSNDPVFGGQPMNNAPKGWYYYE